MRNLALRLLEMEIRRKNIKKDDNTNTEHQYHGKAIILHYNDEIFKQIYDSEKSVHVIVDEGVTDIVVDAFCGCNNLASVEIPGSVISIGHRAFDDCSSLESIIWQDKTYGSADEFIEAFEAFGYFKFG